MAKYHMSPKEFIESGLPMNSYYLAEFTNEQRLEIAEDLVVEPNQFSTPESDNLDWWLEEWDQHDLNKNRAQEDWF